MVRKLMMLAVVVAAAMALPATLELPEPGLLALDLNEEEFEDYLDMWLEVENLKKYNVSSVAVAAARSSGCQIRVNGDLTEPQPVYLHKGDYLVPTGNTGFIDLGTGEDVTIACTGSGRTITHPQATAILSTATATCVHSNLVSGAGWLNGHGAFGALTCSSNSQYVSEYTADQYCFAGHRVIRIGFWVEDEFYPLFWSCFDPVRLEVLYVWYDQTPPNAVNQSGVSRPSWLVSSFFPGVAINSLYTQAQQKLKIASYVGDQLADKYVTATQYLARGHLCAKTDMIFATGQRATFFFINAAPQWQPFNAGNWNWLEQIVYDPSLRRGTAFVSINNPYYSAEEVRQLQFCEDRCRGDPAFDWLHWQADRVDLGYSFCCSVDDFRRVVPHLPHFVVDGLLA